MASPGGTRVSAGVDELARGRDISAHPRVYAMPPSRDRLPAAHLPLAHLPVPNAAQLAAHRRGVYGFIHFTTNTFTDHEWGFGDESPATFNPSALDAHQWVAAAQSGGLRGLILTAKHHDGFCLWPTATTAHHVGASPFRGGQGDVVGELAAACRAAGLELGLYCSPWDRHHAAYGTPEYVAVYHAQVRELLTLYGELFEFWFDGANGGDGWYGGARDTRRIDARSYYRFDELWTECHARQPGAVLFSDAGPDIRWCGNERGICGTTNWAKVRLDGFAPGVVDDMERLAHGDADGSVWRGVEVDVSIRPGWFWHPNEQPKSGSELFGLWLSSYGRGSTFLLNLTPDRRGLIPNEDLAALADFRARVQAFTAVDVARGKPVTTDFARANCPGSCLVDGDDATAWAMDNGVTSASATVDFGAEERIAGVRLDELIALGQRVESFAIDVWHGHWLEVHRGTTVGAQRIIALPAARTGRLRLRILASQACPVLSRLSVYAG